MTSMNISVEIVSFECKYLMCDRTNWHNIKSVPQHTFHLLIQKAALLLPVNSRGNDFLSSSSQKTSSDIVGRG